MLKGLGYIWSDRGASEREEQREGGEERWNVGRGGEVECRGGGSDKDERGREVAEIER